MDNILDENTASFFAKKKKKPVVSNNGVNSAIGLDIGTANIVVAGQKNDDIHTHSQLNAFFKIPITKTTKKILMGKNILFFEKDGHFFILGNSAENIANIFGRNTKRPIKNGLLNPNEMDGINVLMAILKKLIPEPENPDTPIWFSVPGAPVGKPDSVVYHESILQMNLKNLGYDPKPVNEGLTVIMSELADNNSSGIGISLGGGMCNICLAYLSIPVVSYSIQKGGDFIDNMVGSSLNEPATKIKVIKEQELNLSLEPRNRIETGLHIYYDNLFADLAKSLQDVLGTTEKVSLPNALPLVISGGTVMPRGSREKFVKALDNVDLPIKISDVILAANPLQTTATGALMMAMAEEEI